MYDILILPTLTSLPAGVMKARIKLLSVTLNCFVTGITVHIFWFDPVTLLWILMESK